jgi:small subunit ribosomal protein S6
MARTAAAPATRWAREYETIYILRPDVDNDVAEKIVDRAKDVIARLDGTLTKLDNWGKRRLAYPIQKNNRGIFVYLKYVGYSDLVAELERNLRLLDEVVRFQTVLLAEDIDPASVTVDPEEVQYLHVEEEEETEDAELERARSLGMVPRAPREVPPAREEAPHAASEAPPEPTAEAAVPEAPAEAAEAPAEAVEAPAAAAEAPAAEEATAESTEAPSDEDKREEG